MIDSLHTALHSFANNYQAIMWHLRECSLNDEQLGMALGVSGNAIRNRRAKPDLWKLSDVKRLAIYFTLPVTACLQLDQTLRELPGHLRAIPNDQRRKVERLLVIKINQLEVYNQSDWPVRQLLRMNGALTSDNR